MGLLNFEHEFNKEKEKTFKVMKSPKKIIYSKDHQIGSTNIKRDMVRTAILPGKRISKTGKVYYEYRKNRSDSEDKKI